MRTLMRPVADMWGGANYKQPLYPNSDMPKWAQLAAKRMKGMNLNDEQICNTLVAMNKVHREVKTVICGTEYEIVID